jgi:hypothetical protein
MPTPDLAFTPPNNGEIAADVRQSFARVETIGRVMALWGKYAALKELPRYPLDPQTGRFVQPNGRLLPFPVLRTNVQRLANGVGRGELGEMTKRLQKGTVPLAEWYSTMRDTSRDAYLAAVLVALGGIDRLNATPPQAREEVYRLAEFQEQKLRDMAVELQRDWDGKSTAAYSRAIMYGAAVYGLFSNSNRFLMEVLGFNQERRVLAAAEHCTDCVGYASVGWRPTGSLPRIGDSKCLSYCHCYFVFRRQ